MRYNEFVATEHINVVKTEITNAAYDRLEREAVEIRVRIRGAIGKRPRGREFGVRNLASALIEVIAAAQPESVESTILKRAADVAFQQYTGLTNSPGSERMEPSQGEQRPIINAQAPPDRPPVAPNTVARRKRRKENPHTDEDASKR